MFNVRKVLAAGVIVSALAGGFISTSTTSASAQWLVRGMPLQVGAVHYRVYPRYYGYHRYYGFHRYYGYHRFYRHRYFLGNCFAIGVC